MFDPQASRERTVNFDRETFFLSDRTQCSHEGTDIFLGPFVLLPALPLELLDLHSQLIHHILLLQEFLPRLLGLLVLFEDSLCLMHNPEHVVRAIDRQEGDYFLLLFQEVLPHAVLYLLVLRQ